MNLDSNAGAGGAGLLNAGVGGDKVQNVIYQAVGDSERGLPGLVPALAEILQEMEDS
ncbi:hypothetical protein VTK26DRAFT_4962 [Humicola hyalothermophila]